VTTSNNFEATDGIKIAWGEENEDGAVNPGGIDDVTLSYLNEHRSIMDWSTGQYVDTAGWAGTLLVRIEGNEPNGFYPSNAVSYEKGDRRYVDAIRKPYFDITPEEEITLVKTTIPFVDGMTIAANIKSIKPRESYGYTQTILSKEKLTDATLDGKTPDTFTIEEPYVDTLSVTANGAGSTSEYDDYTNEYGAYMDNNTNPQGAELKSNTTYTYSLFAYYERPSNFVFQGSGSSTMLMRIYAPVKVKEFSTFIEIKNMPNASIITCGAAINEYNYYVGTDDGIFYTDMNKGLTKSEGTYEHEVYSILIDEQTTSFYDYGYGYSEYVDGMDFFDAFGEEGLLYGYSVYGYNAHYGYGYAYGYESDSSNIIYAATNKGILMSIDGGKVFENIFSSEYYNIKHVFCLEKDRDGNVLAGTDKGIYRKDPTDDTLWYFDSVVGSADYAPLGKILGQTFKLT
jgi:hypothetical protein